MHSSPDSLKKTPPYDLHVQLDAKMVEFAGYSMPVQYPDGVLKEHLQTRNAAGLFDVSHMGQIILRGKDVASALETLVPGDIVDLPIGKQCYTLLTNDSGGVLDDLMVVNHGEYLMLVVNAACKLADEAHLRQNLPAHIDIEVVDDRALLAIQGPKAANVIAKLSNSKSDGMVFMDTAQMQLDGIDCFITRSGYTGEDGFEISVKGVDAVNLCKVILANEQVKMIGLGARDSLRLEAGLCLYGHELTADITPVDASLNWAIAKCRRTGGTRQGGFPGAERIFQQLIDGPASKRVGLRSLGRAPIREGVQLLNDTGQTVGEVSSGGYGPSVKGPIAMAYVDKEYTGIGTQLFALLRGKKIPLTVSAPIFVETHYFRG